MAPENEGNYHGHEGGGSLRAPPPPSPNPNSYGFGGASPPSQGSRVFSFTSYQPPGAALRPGYESQQGTKRQKGHVKKAVKKGDETEDEDEDNGAKRRRVRSPTPENLKDYPVPDYDNMLIPLYEQTYTTRLTKKPTKTTTAEFMLQGLDFLKAQKARRERDDREMFVGLTNFEGNQRGWNGLPEAERRKEEEARRTSDTEEDVEDTRNEDSKMVTSPAKRKKDTTRLLEEGFEDLQSSYAINTLLLEDLVEHEQEHNRAEMASNSRGWDADAIRSAALEDRERKLEKERLEDERQMEDSRIRDLDLFATNKSTEIKDEKSDGKKNTLLGMLSLFSSPLKVVSKNPFKKSTSLKDEKLEEKDVKFSESDFSLSAGGGQGLGVGLGIGDSLSRGPRLSKKKKRKPIPIYVKEEWADEKKEDCDDKSPEA